MASAKKSRTSERDQSASSIAGDQVDASLKKYRSMRDFGITREPRGGSKSTSPRLPFCVQKHSASHLHYDFRLGWDGVLKSWAVAKGPSAVVRDRRLAVQVEDHPLEYGGFEGIIPQGQYGGGTVMLWDEGTWEPQPEHEDVVAGLREGSLKFVLHGHRLKGRWTLVRMGGKAATERKPNWLLIKEHDEWERQANVPNLTDEATTSVATGRTMDEIAANRDHVWNSRETAGRGQAWVRQEAEKPAAHGKFTVRPRPGRASAGAGSKPPHQADVSAFAGLLESLPKEGQADFIKPQLAAEAADPPDGPDWLFELKLDGYRMQARKHGKQVQMLTRSGLDWTHRVAAVAQELTKLPWERITLDGEVVVLAPDGTTNFAQLQASFQEGARFPLSFFCFDLLHINGRSPRSLPLRERKALLAEALAPAAGEIVRFCEDVSGDGAVIFQQACKLRAEGVIAKRSDTPYRPGRGEDWRKLKCLHEQEFVVGGFTLSTEGPDRIGSLLLGYYDEDGITFRYAGRTGTGFTQVAKRQLRRQLNSAQRAKPAFLHIPASARRNVQWVSPELVVQVRFASWTADHLVRHAAFLGVREDKAANEVRLEAGGPAPKRSVSRMEKAPRPRQATSSEGPTWANLPLPVVRLTHPEKVLDSESGTTKQMLAQFYAAVAPRMLPFIADRPLSLVRCPDGATKPCFYQKHVNHLLPAGVTSVPVRDRKTGKTEPYITLSSAEALAGLAQMGCLEVHPWGSTNKDLEHADRLTFDLDPDEALPWQTVSEAALEIRKALRSLGLESFLKTTGGKGLHIVVPVARTPSWDDVKTWTRNFALAIERRAPQRYLTKMTKAARSGRIYLDYLRNERGATAVAPYSPRARGGLPVSLPLAWSELGSTERPHFGLAQFPSWRDRLRRDPWARLPSVKQTLPTGTIQL